jgi:rubredoxin
MSQRVEIVCSKCGADTLVKREPVYEGFRKVGERWVCTACGHVYDREGEVPFKETAAVGIFTDEDRPRRIDVFEAGEKNRNCRHCRHYVVNPFTQRCGLHRRNVEATDLCDDFNRTESPPGEPGPKG